MSEPYTAYIEARDKKTPTSFVDRFAESDLYPILREMEYDDKSIHHFQRNRVISFFLLALTGLVLMYFTRIWYFAAGGIVLAFLKWWNDYRQVTSNYEFSQYKRNVIFIRFIRLLVPMKMLPDLSFVKILEKLSRRRDIAQGQFKKALDHFIYNVKDDPESDRPYIQFAHEASGTEHAMLFMTTLYSYIQTSDDIHVLQNLARRLSDEINEIMDEILEYEQKRLFFFPTKLAMTGIIILIFYTASVFSGLSKLITVGG